MFAKEKLTMFARNAWGMRYLRMIVVSLILGPFALAPVPARAEISEGKNQLLETFQTDGRSVREIIDLLSESSGLNIVATPEAAEKTVTLTLRNVRVIDAIEIMAKISSLWYREEETTGTIRLMTTEQFQEDLVVFRNDATRVFTLLHPNALTIAMTIRNLYGPRVVLSPQFFDDDIMVGISGIGLSQLATTGGLEMRSPSFSL